MMTSKLVRASSAHSRQSEETKADVLQKRVTFAEESAKKMRQKKPTANENVQGLGNLSVGNTMGRFNERTAA